MTNFAKLPRAGGQGDGGWHAGVLISPFSTDSYSIELHFCLIFLQLSSMLAPFYCIIPIFTPFSTLFDSVFLQPWSILLGITPTFTRFYSISPTLVQVYIEAVRFNSTAPTKVRFHPVLCCFMLFCAVLCAVLCCFVCCFMLFCVLFCNVWCCLYAVFMLKMLDLIRNPWRGRLSTAQRRWCGTAAEHT